MFIDCSCIVAAAGKLYGLHTDSGEIIWQSYLFAAHSQAHAQAQLGKQTRTDKQSCSPSFSVVVDRMHLTTPHEIAVVAHHVSVRPLVVHCFAFRIQYLIVLFCSPLGPSSARFTRCIRSLANPCSRQNQLHNQTIHWLASVISFTLLRFRFSFTHTKRAHTAGIC